MMLQNVQQKNTDKKRFRSEVTADQMDQFLSRPITKIQNLNRSLRKSYESGFFKKQKFDQLRELKNKSQDYDQQNISENEYQDDSVFTVHNDKRSRRRRERQKRLSLEGKKDDKKDTVGIIKGHSKVKGKAKIGIEQTKVEEQSKKEESSSSGQSGEGSASKSQSGSSNESSSSSQSQQSQSKEVASQKDNQNINKPNIETNIIIRNPSIEQPVNTVKKEQNYYITQQKVPQNNQINKPSRQEGQRSGQKNKLGKHKNKVQQQQQQQSVLQTKIKIQAFQNNKSKKEYPKINNLQSEDQQNKLKKLAEVNEATIQRKTRSKIKIGLSMDSGQVSQVKNNNPDNNSRNVKNKQKQKKQDQSKKSSKKNKQKPGDEGPQKNPKRFIEYQIQAKRKFHYLSYCSKVVIQSIFMRVPHYFYAYSPREAELMASHGIQTANLNQKYLISQVHQKTFPIGSFRRKKIVEMQQLSDQQEIQEQQGSKDEQSQRINPKQEKVDLQKTQKNRNNPKKQGTDQKQDKKNRIRRVPRQLQLLLDSRASSDRRRIRHIPKEQSAQIKIDNRNEVIQVVEKQKYIPKQVQQNEINKEISHIQQEFAQRVKQKQKKIRKDKLRYSQQE